VPEEQEIQEPKAEKPAKSKKKLILGIAVFGVSFILLGVGNYYYLKSTYVPPPPPPPPEEKQPVLAIDFDGEEEKAAPSEAAADSVPLAPVEAGIAAADSTPQLDSLQMVPIETASTGEAAASLEEAEPEEETALVQPPPVTEARVDSAALKRSAKLAKIVENMPAEDAAQMLEALSNEMVIDVLLRLKQRQAAKIMAALPASRAADISRLILEPIAQQQ
jgi:flagellar motility protein MotE (MotC chaperone)